MYGYTLEIMQRLQEEPDDVMRKAYAGQALICAAWKGHIETVVALCEAGANVDYKNQRGQTALMYAARWGRGDIMKALIKFGAKPETTDSCERTAINYAEEGNQTDAIDILKQSLKLAPKATE
jgi:ankyrin repeat protein